jgi:hypothetical protein
LPIPRDPGGPTGTDPEEVNIGVVGRVEECCEGYASRSKPSESRMEDRRHCAGTWPDGRPRHKLYLPLGTPSLVRLDIDGDLEPILFESLRAYTEQEQTMARITATFEGEPMALGVVGIGD